ncbi:hypothetical protein Poli38472_007369 [Pythium oligandrum]|uniref:Transcription initiation factor TFIID subunit 10 n=1 Tax=Pythium oligandrum TaxID=41045 RepID=A0A8K1CA13_PYTOL|nr:hypothetical protein Poli38472_007369 [Pythium oligandrum]|eukprot:TMW59224.1 hypothetical protein Poli38472_007369 [Pythium oligandrum]
MASYAPTIPEELVDYYLQQVGFTTSDPRILRMISLVAHKFLLDVTQDAMQYQRIRAQTSAGASAASSAGASGAATTPNATKTVLTIEDLSASLKEYGVTLSKPEYYSDVDKE